MEENQESLYSVRVDFGETEKRINEVTLALLDNAKATKDLTTQQKALESEISDLDKELKTNGALTDEQAKRLKDLQSEYTQVSRSIVENRAKNRELSAEQKSLIQTTTSQSESIKQLRAELALNTAAYNAMSKEQRENSAEGLKLAGRTKELSDELKRLEGRVGDTRRNVGNYRDSIREAFAGTQIFGRSLGDLGNAIKTNPIGLLISALAFVFAGFAKVQPVADLFKETLGSLTAIFDVITARAGLLFEAFTKLFQGDFTGAIESTKQAFTGLGDAISQAVEFGQAYEKVLKSIDDTSQQLEVTEAKNEARIARLNRQFADRTKSDKERIAIAKEIQQLEQETFTQRDQLLRQQANLERSALRLALAQKGVTEAAEATDEALIQLAQNNAIQDEAFIKFKDATVAIYKNEAQSISIIERAKAREALVTQQSEERKQKSIEATNKELERQKQLQDAQTKAFNELSKKELELSLKAIDSAFKAEEAKEKENFASRLEFVQGNLEQERLLTEDFQRQSVERKALQLEQEITTLKDYALTVEGVETQLAAKQAELSNLVADAKINDIKAVTKTQQDEAKKQEAAAQQQAEAQKQIFAQLAQDLGADITAAVDAIFQGQENATDKFLSSILTTVLDTIEKTLIAQQAAAIAATTFQEIATKGVAGLLTAAANIAIIKGAFAVAKNVIRGSFEQFEDGGQIEGARHRSGGVVIEAEGGEYIVNRKATAQFLPLLESINKTGLPQFESGGFVGNPVVPSIFTADTNNPNLALLESFANKPIYTDITEIRAVNNKVNVTQRRRKA